MVNKRVTPTNKKFKKHFEDFASSKPKKGHLGKGERENDETAIKVGTLIRINRNKIYDRGWEVQVDGKTYMCTYMDNVVMIPDSTVTKKYYIPKKRTKVEIQMDKVSHIYTIIRIQSDNTTPIALYNDNLTIASDTNTKTNKKKQAKISLTSNNVSISAKNMSVDSDLTIDGNVSADNITKIEKTTTDNTKNIKSNTEDIASLMDRVKILEDKTKSSTDGD